jgi:hypothetical protein
MFLSRPYEDSQEAPKRESAARWAGPGLIMIRDPFTGEWHEWQADRRRKGRTA